MTHDELREKVARALCRAAYPMDKFPDLDIDEQATDPHWHEQAAIAIAVVLEEAARVAEDQEDYTAQRPNGVLRRSIAAAIRGLIRE